MLRPAAVVFFGNLFARALGFLYPVLLAQVLGRQDFALAIFLISTGFFAGELVLAGFPTALTRALATERDDGDRGRWLGSAMVGGIPLLIGSLAFGAVLAIQADAPPLLLGLVVVGLAFDAYYFALLRGLQRFGTLVAYRISANVAQLALLALVAATGGVTLTVAMAIYSLVYLVPIAVLELRRQPNHVPIRSIRADRVAIRQLTTFAIPALLSGTAYGAMMGFDVFFVRTLAGDALADYGAARSLAVAMLLVPFAITTVLLPRTAAASDARRRSLLLLALPAVALVDVVAWIAYALAGPSLIGLLFPPTFAGAVAPLATLVPAIAVIGLYSVLSQWWYGIGRPWTPAFCLAFGATVTIAGHLVLTSRFGGSGAGIAIGLGAAVAFVCLALRTRSAGVVAGRRGPGRPQRIFLVGWYGVDNVGGDAIRGAIEASAERLGVDIVAYTWRGPPTTDPRAVRVSIRSLPAYLRAVLSSDRVVLGGGGIFKDEGLRIAAELFAVALVGRVVGREVTLLAVGVGPIYGRVGGWLLGMAGRLAQIRTVRDDGSAKAFARMGVRQVVIGADPVFSLPLAQIAPSTDDRRNDSPGGPALATVLVSVRPWAFRGQPAGIGQDRFRAEVAAALQPLIDMGCTIEFVALHWPRDRDEAVAVAAQLGPLAGLRLPAGPMTMQGLRAAAARSDVVVAMRYHAVAAALLEGRPVVALAYEPKVAALAAETGIPSVDLEAGSVGDRIRLAIREARPEGPERQAALAELHDRARLAIDLALVGAPVATAPKPGSSPQLRTDRR